MLPRGYGRGQHRLSAASFWCSKAGAAGSAPGMRPMSFRSIAAILKNIRSSCPAACGSGRLLRARAGLEPDCLRRAVHGARRGLEAAHAGSGYFIGRAIPLRRPARRSGGGRARRRSHRRPGRARAVSSARRRPPERAREDDLPSVFATVQSYLKDDPLFSHIHDTDERRRP